ncbi:hypothetical protein BLNAU_15677 [Blattamonas nauphoetae]|uniref:Uncharacterized protein n=1 Tax=Blattamonas nauphoetae TaxID=2049346 RepID=A0ABQ9XBT4_9EUKA|nr:hypothetical protein BLNAU_15677 [Blattamonas nauphoetae]
MGNQISNCNLTMTGSVGIWRQFEESHLEMTLTMGGWTRDLAGRTQQRKLLAVRAQETEEEITQRVNEQRKQLQACHNKTLEKKYHNELLEASQKLDNTNEKGYMQLVPLTQLENEKNTEGKDKYKESIPPGNQFGGTSFGPDCKGKEDLKPLCPSSMRILSRSSHHRRERRRCCEQQAAIGDRASNTVLTEGTETLEELEHRMEAMQKKNIKAEVKEETREINKVADKLDAMYLQSQSFCHCKIQQITPLAEFVRENAMSPQSFESASLDDIVRDN